MRTWFSSKPQKKQVTNWWTNGEIADAYFESLTDDQKKELATISHNFYNWKNPFIFEHGSTIVKRYNIEDDVGSVDSNSLKIVIDVIRKCKNGG